MNKFIKIAHEAPISIFEKIQKLTDIDYALVHLFEESADYFNLFKDAVEKGREVILDNSVFELGVSFDAKSYVKWIQKLKPTWYVIPDSLENADKTKSLANQFVTEHPNLPGKSIGVVQGKSYDEIVSCYKHMDGVVNVDMLAISFDYSFYRDTVKNKDLTHVEKYALGRSLLLDRLYQDGIVNKNKPHHLLGVGVPQEGLRYKNKGYGDWLYSIDTSNPVVHGIKGVKYDSNKGLKDKKSQKLHTMINSAETEFDFNIIEHNVLEFKKMWLL